MAESGRPECYYSGPMVKNISFSHFPDFYSFLNAFLFCILAHQRCGAMTGSLFCCFNNFDILTLKDRSLVPRRIANCAVSCCISVSQRKLMDFQTA